MSETATYREARTGDRPALLLPPAEAEALRLAYEGASEILEYGAGGSTFLAAGMSGKRVTSVESDRAWARRVEAGLAALPVAEGTQVEIAWCDIGPTRDWGHPADDSGWARYPAYPMGVWQRPVPVAPDVVFVDGRFRIGCTLAAAFLTEKPLTLLIDDYTTRAAYRRVEAFLGTPETVGRMARFHLAPRLIPKRDWLRITKFMYRPL